MFSIRKIIQKIPVKNTISSQILKQTRGLSYKSDHGVSRSIDRHGTTIIVVRKDGVTVMAGDGQVRFYGYIYICTYIYIYIYVYICVCVYTYVYMYIYICTSIHINIHV
jgi:hypothetical protein